MAASKRTSLAPADVLDISFSVSLDQEYQLTVKYKATNIGNENVYVFVQSPPFVRLWMNGRVHLMSTMPELTEWMEVIAPRVPPVQLLRVGESLEGEATYALPLKESFPYPAASSELPRIPLKRIQSQEFVMFFGFFPSCDDIKLFERPDLNGSVPGYYSLKRQFIAKSKPAKLSTFVDCPIINIPNQLDANCFE